MKRRAPLERKKPMPRGKPLERRKPLKVAPRPKPTWAGGEDEEAWAAWEALRQAVHDRAEGRCEAGVTPQCRERDRLFVRLGGHQAHHRKLRVQGGPDAVENLLALCGYCHEWVHKHPVKATELGLMVPSWADPAVRGVILADGSTVALTADGYAHFMDAPEAVGS